MEKSGGKLVVVCKRECATCEMIVPVLKEIEAGGVSLTIYTQDDPGFPDGLSYVSHDDQLENSRRLGIETVPTLIRYEHGREAGRVQGWDRAEWRILSGFISCVRASGLCMAITRTRTPRLAIARTASHTKTA
ncbi:MAG: thioredoxin family protein [Desulfosalsimonas sp.]